MHLLWVYEFICYISIYIYYRTFCYLLFLPSPIYHFRILLALSKTHCCIWFSNIYFDLKSIKRVKSTRHETDFTDKYNLSLWLPWTFYIMFIAGECLFVNCFTTCNNCFFFFCSFLCFKFFEMLAQFVCVCFCVEMNWKFEFYLMEQITEILFYG